MQNNSIPTLVIFCKRPLLGQGKQRLAATLGQQVALTIAEHILNCALEDATDWQGCVVLAISNPGDEKWAKTLLTHNYQVICQPLGNLGQRINNIDTQLRKEGHDKLIFIGTDAPVLTMRNYVDVAAKLRSHHAVFSRASDGGVTIMANSSAWPDLTLLPWSTDQLGQDLFTLCNDNQWALDYINNTYDIDIESDLLNLRIDLTNDNRPARKALLAQLVNIELAA